MKRVRNADFAHVADCFMEAAAFDSACGVLRRLVNVFEGEESAQTFDNLVDDLENAERFVENRGGVEAARQALNLNKLVAETRDLGH